MYTNCFNALQETVTSLRFMRYFEYGSYKGHASREFTCVCPLAKASVKFITVTVKSYE